MSDILDTMTKARFSEWEREQKEKSEKKENRSKMWEGIAIRSTMILWNAACSSWALWLPKELGAPSWVGWPLFIISMMTWLAIDEIRSVKNLLEKKNEE